MSLVPCSIRCVETGKQRRRTPEDLMSRALCQEGKEGPRMLRLAGDEGAET